MGKRINSKAKGNTFERAVAKKLTEVFKDNTPDKFAKSPSSGAYFGGKNATLNADLSDSAKRSMTGDLIVPDDFKFFIEAKSYKTIDTYNLITKTNYKQDFYDWIEECFDAENDNYDGWIIIAKQNRKDWLLCIEDDLFEELYNGECERYLQISYKNNKYIILSFEEFFNNVEKEKFFYK